MQSPLCVQPATSHRPASPASLLPAGYSYLAVPRCGSDSTWPQLEAPPASALTSQLSAFEVQAAGGGAALLGTPVRLASAARGGAAGCPAFLRPQSVGSCDRALTLLGARSSDGGAAAQPELWVLERVAGEPGAVRIRSLARRACAARYLGASAALGYCGHLGQLFRGDDRHALLTWRLVPADT